MKNILLIYIVTQLITTSYGLAVIESVRPFVESKLKEQGYHKNKNSMYRFNNTLSNILKAFIPFYYLTKALNIIISKGNVDNIVNENIKNKNYVNEEENIIKADVQVIEDTKSDDLVNNMNLVFEKPEKYTARKNDIHLLDTYEEDVEFITRDSTEEDKLELSPFISNEPIIKEVEVRVKEEITNKDIAKKICELTNPELDSLVKTINELKRINSANKELKLEKDVA